MPPATEDAQRVDAVVIGRNEGARLTECLASLKGRVDRIVYVDSGSDDGSPEAARDAGACVVALDMARPFSAARARNAGIQALAGDPPALIQFVDADCTLQPGWIATAARFMRDNASVAVTCGRRRERFPQASIYNLLCDWEWDTAIGEASACGGDALIRYDALSAVGGYRDDAIAGEEGEMCQRLRNAGWRVWRLDEEMTLHDAAITRLGAFWRRAVRAGHAFAQIATLHPGHYRAERRRALFWAAGLPAGLAAGLALSPGLALGAGLALYGASVARMALRLRQRGFTTRQAGRAAALLMLSKFANLQGMALWHWRRLRGAPAGIIEYKPAARAGRTE